MTARMKVFFTSLLQPIFGIIVGLAIGVGVTYFAGESPTHVLKVLFHSAFGSPYDLGMTLFYTTPLLFAGLAVALPFQGGLFNIGAEGQLTMGAMAAATVGILFPNVSWPFAPILAALGAFAAGALWAGIAGWLRSYRGSHEVITTIMLNFVAAGITSYWALYTFKNPESQNPDTVAVGAGYRLQHWKYFQDSAVSSALILAVASALILWVLLRKTVLGYEIQAVGQNETAAQANGIDVKRIRWITMGIAGGLAGLVGVSEVLGNSGRFLVGFSADYGFTGIAVALVARGNPLGILFSALLFGALHKGTADLDFETEHVTRDLAQILQALVILSVSAVGVWDWLRKRGRRG